ncbi:hypothetical protein BLA29_012621 [Euroglyphus maynei]|uniref:Uncharacterized protein n=1 Tax=Euroglyphus maynei TaxID=6958 RepID=A0A1Y3BGR9_EURMA|nr:hypothetical protein BLA29_012621 [Euroglyphus maynei]
MIYHNILKSILAVSIIYRPSVHKVDRIHWNMYKNLN